MYKFIVVTCYVVILAEATSGRIGDQSALECDKYAKYTKPFIDSSIFIVRKTNGFSVTNKCSGVLVSDQYFLTSHECGVDIVVRLSQVLLYRERFEVITDVYTFESENGDENIIALLKLQYPIDPSQHRPACLWFYDYRPEFQWVVQHSSNPSYIPEDPTARYNAFKFEPVGLLPADDCQKHYNITNTCFYTTHNTRPDFKPNDGSPVLYYDDTSKGVYVTGIFKNQYTFENTSVLLVETVELNSNHIEWIESIVWSKYDTRELTCGILKITHQPFITYGVDTYPGQFPWHVAIYRRETVGYSRYICGGTIINANIIITAAHCISSEFGIISTDVLTVEVGKHDLDVHTRDSYGLVVAEVIPHEHYKRDILENDIGILKLKNAIEFSNYIQPACITNDTNIFKTNLGIVPGWGRDEYDIQTHVLAQATLPIRTNHECRASNRGFFIHFLNEYNFCAGYKNGTNVCTGDSGGGLVLQQNERWYLKGIVSFGVSTPNLRRCDPTELVLFTDVVKFYGWIISKL